MKGEKLQIGLPNSNFVLFKRYRLEEKSTKYISEFRKQLYLKCRETSYNSIIRQRTIFFKRAKDLNKHFMKIYEWEISP